jgi:curved DNA-binding protein CbpA
MAANHYQRLGVSPRAAHDEIRKAYHRLALRHHPDANPDAETESRRAMAEINAAWEVLSDAERRRAYDRAIGVTPAPTTAGSAFRPFDDEADEADLWHLRDEPVVARRPRPADLLMMIPVFLLLAEVLTFAFSMMSAHDGLRTAAILMAPVTAGSFVAAPLFTMLRARDRDRR